MNVDFSTEHERFREIQAAEEKARKAYRRNIDEAYMHCPRALKFSRLWDTGTIAANATDKPEKYWYKRWTQESKKEKLK